MTRLTDGKASEKVQIKFKCNFVILAENFLTGYGRQNFRTTFQTIDITIISATTLHIT